MPLETARGHPAHGSGRSFFSALPARARPQTMPGAQMIFAVLLPGFLDWLPLTAAVGLAAVGPIDGVPIASLIAYVRRQKQRCLEKLAPILASGFHAPCLSFRHYPVVLWPPSFNRGPTHDDVVAVAASALGVAPQPPGAFERFMLQDRASGEWERCSIGFQVSMTNYLVFVPICSAAHALPGYCCAVHCPALSFSLAAAFVQANDDAEAWFPIWNYDNGGTVDYDAAVLWLDQRLQLVVWYPDAVSGTLAAGVAEQFPTLPAAGSHGAFFFLYVEDRNVGMLLVCWEPEDPTGWPLQAGTAQEPLQTASSA